MAGKLRSFLLVGGAVALIAAPLVIPGLRGDFKGSDDKGAEAIAELAPHYKPWFQSLWTPPSDEVQSLLFCVQAALGAGLLGYVIGRRSARKNVADR